MLKKNSKIAIDCRMLDCSGIGTFLNGILTYLFEYTEWSFLLIGNKEKLSKYKKYNVKIHNCNIPIFTLKEQLKFPYKDVNCCDCFFSPNYNIPLGIKIPIFSTIHDVIYLDRYELSGKIGRQIRKLAVWFSIIKSIHIFTVSKFSKERILFHFPKAKSISVCYNGADNIEPVESDSLTKLSLKQYDYYIYIGNIKPHKGLGTLIDAYARLKTNKKLVIVGNAEAFRTGANNIYHKIINLNKSGNIIFTGRVSSEWLGTLLKNAYCLVQPSEYEGFGLPPLEAMKLGTPVILSDIPVFKELYSNFPLAFFKVSDAKSLSQQMKRKQNRIKLSDELLNLYTYKKASIEIIQTINSLLPND